MSTRRPYFAGTIALLVGCGGDTAVRGSSVSTADAGATGPDAAHTLVPSACIFNQGGAPQPAIQKLDPGTIQVACFGRASAGVFSIQDTAGQGFDWKASVESPHGFFNPDPVTGSACPGFVGFGVDSSGVDVAPPANARPGDSDDGTMTVVTSAPSIGPLRADVHAVVVPTSFRVSPVALDFARVAIGQNAAIAVTVENTSTVPLLVSPTPTPTSPFSVRYWGPHGEDCCPIPTLDPGQSGQMVTFVFAPVIPGVATLELDLTPFPSDQSVPPECGSPVHLTLKGEGVAGPADAGALP